MQNLAANKRDKQQGKKTFKVEVTKDGPYAVSGGLPLTEQIIVCNPAGDPLEWRTGKEHPRQEEYALCRCGRSKGKPFCDRTHLQVSFDGAETASHEPYLEQSDLMDGPALQLTDKKVLCAGAGFCSRDGGTWDLTKRSDNLEARKAAIEEAGACPSGRLVVWDKNGEAIEPELEPSIGLIEGPEAGMSGPIWVRGEIPIEGADGAAYETRNRVTLCRCGRSSNKPFCDGGHQTRAP